MTNKNIFFKSLPDFEALAEEEKRLRKLPKEPTFSLKDMEEAREKAFQNGHEVGLQKAKDSIEQQIEIMVQSLIERIHDLEQAENQRNQDAIKNSIAISSRALHQVLSTTLDQQKELLMQQALGNFFSDHINKNELALFVHPDMQKPMEKYAKMLNPEIKLTTDDTMNKTDIRINWIDGTFEFTPEKLISDIFAVIDGHSEPLSQTLDDSSQTPHTDTIETQEDKDS